MMDESQLFSAFLRALSDPDGGLDLYGLHAADSPLRTNEGMKPADEIDPHAFALGHRQTSIEGGHLLPRFSAPTLRDVSPESDGLHGVAWFELTEEREGRALVAALGVQTARDAPRIAFCTLFERPGSVSFQQARLQSLADYPWMHQREAAAARALIDASYFRLYRRSADRFYSLPEARFSCHMSTACCRHDFEITLPPDAQLLIDSMPWSTLAPQLAHTRLPMRPDGKLQLKAVDETCRFLSASGRCLIHQTLGRQPFGTCDVFPFSFARTPEGIAVGQSPVCGSTRLGLGLRLEDREDDLRERLVHVQPRATQSYRLAPELAVSWERFRDIEKALCDCIASAELPMRRRLYVGSRLLGALRDEAPIDLNAWVHEPPVTLESGLREAIRGMLSRALKCNREALRSLPQDLPMQLHCLEVADAPIVMRILQNTLFCKVYSYPFDLTTAHNLLIVLYLLTLIMQAAANGPLSDRMWRELGSLGVHGMLRTAVLEGMPEGFRALFGTSQFGLWLLAA